MKNLFPGTLLAFFMISAAGYSAPYSGRVFADRNNNGIFDKGDRPLKGISVSDGLHVLKTAEDGTFTLPGHDRERFVFITTPSGYKSDNRYYRKIEDGAAYDFALQPYDGGIAKDGSHSYIHIADTEIFNTENQEDWVGNLRDYAAGGGAAFIVHTGDICYEKGLKAHFPLMNTANMNCPVFYCVGNHDLVKGKYGEELFENIYGPVYYSFEVGNVHYIVTPMAGGDHAPGYTKQDVSRWMANDLAQMSPGKAVVVFNHDLLTYGDKFVFGPDGGETVDLNAYNLKAWVYGHWHIHYMKKQGAVRTVSTATLDKGGIDHSTSAFRVLHVDKNGDFTSELRYAYLDKSLCIAVPSNGQAPVSAQGTIPVSVNVYASAHPVTEVSYVLDSDNGKGPVKGSLTRRTDWNWSADVRIDALGYGKEISLKVLARFSNGETAENETAFVCNPDSTPEVRLGASWANLGGNTAHTGIAADTLKTPLKLAWVSNVGANIFMSSPLVYGKRIYTASVDENLCGQAHIYALDGKTGAILWKYPVRNSVKNTIAADNGTIFAQDAEGNLYAIDAETGILRWERELPINGLPALIEGLAASKGIVYAGTGKGLCAVDGKSGTVLWQNSSWGQGEGTTSTLTLGNGVLITGVQWTGLYANNASTGELLWRDGKNGLSDRGASPAIHGNLLYVISRKSLFVMEAATGRTVLRKELPFDVDVTSTPLLTNREIIFGTTRDGMVAFDCETFEPKWTFKTDDALVYTAPYTRKPASTVETSAVCSGSVVYFGASDGGFYGLDRETGKPLWKYRTGAPVFASVAVSGNTLVGVDFSGNVYTFVSAE